MLSVACNLLKQWMNNHEAVVFRRRPFIEVTVSVCILTAPLPKWKQVNGNVIHKLDKDCFAGIY